MSRRSFDLIAVWSSALAVAMMVGYLVLMRQEADDPAIWFLVALSAGAVAAGYGAYREAPHRTGALVFAGVVLVCSGLLAILSIGFPVVLAGIGCVVAAARASTSGPAPTPGGRP